MSLGDRQPHTNPTDHRETGGNSGKGRAQKNPAQKGFLGVSPGQRIGLNCPYKAEVGGSSPSTPTGETPAQRGFLRESGELDNGVLDTLRTRIGRDLFVECFCRGLIHALIKMPVDIQSRPNRGMAETIGDDLGMLSLGDEQRYLGVPKRVGSEILV